MLNFFANVFGGLALIAAPSGDENISVDESALAENIETELAESSLPSSVEERRTEWRCISDREAKERGRNYCLVRCKLEREWVEVGRGRRFVYDREDRETCQDLGIDYCESRWDPNYGVWDAVSERGHCWGEDRYERDN